MWRSGYVAPTELNGDSQNEFYKHLVPRGRYLRALSCGSPQIFTPNVFSDISIAVLLTPSEESHGLPT